MTGFRMTGPGPAGAPGRIPTQRRTRAGRDVSRLLGDFGHDPAHAGPAAAACPAGPAIPACAPPGGPPGGAGLVAGVGAGVGVADDQ